jgi:hypothetical protein
MFVIDSHVKWHPFVNVHCIDLSFDQQQQQQQQPHINTHHFQKKKTNQKSKIFTSALLSRRI